MPEATNKCSLLLASDTRLVLESLVWALGRHNRFLIVGAAASCAELIQSVIARTPDILIADGSLLRSESVKKALSACASNTRTIAFGISNERDSILACAEAGVAGYVTSDAGIQELIQTLDAALKGEILCPPAIAASAFSHIAFLAAGRSRETNLPLLPHRQTQILSMIELGLTNKEIAARLGIELSTVKNHVHALLLKIGAKRRTQAAAKCRLAKLQST